MELELGTGLVSLDGVDGRSVVGPNVLALEERHRDRKQHIIRGDFEGALTRFEGALEVDPSIVASQDHRAATLLALSDSSDSAASRHRTPMRKG